MEFLIKWKGWSHLHDTWDTYNNLRTFKGFKKLENYIKNHQIEQKMLQESTNAEDIETSNVRREMARDTLKDYKAIERIIATRVSSPGGSTTDRNYEYLCKWKRLPYSECTWEGAELIQRDFQAEIDAFLDRNNSQRLPYKSKPYTQKRPTFKRITEQPPYIVGGELRDFQLTGLNWLAHLWSKNENGILADEVCFCFRPSLNCP